LLADMSRKKLVDHLREQGAARRDFRRVQASGTGQHEAVDPGSSPSQHVEAAEILSEFRKRLSAEERRLADDRAQVRGWGQIAAERGGSPDGLRKQLARAVERVAQELGLEA